MSRSLCSSASRRLPAGNRYSLDSTRVPNSRQRVPAHGQEQDPASAGARSTPPVTCRSSARSAVAQWVPLGPCRRWTTLSVARDVRAGQSAPSGDWRRPRPSHRPAELVEFFRAGDFFKQFMDDEDFKRWMTARVFELASEQAGRTLPARNAADSTGADPSGRRAIPYRTSAKAIGGRASRGSLAASHATTHGSGSGLVSSDRTLVSSRITTGRQVLARGGARGGTARCLRPAQRARSGRAGIRRRRGGPRRHGPESTGPAPRGCTPAVSAPPEPRLRLLRQIPDRDACHRAFPVAVLTMRASPPTDRSPAAWRFVVVWYSG